MLSHLGNLFDFSPKKACITWKKKIALVSLEILLLDQRNMLVSFLLHHERKKERAKRDMTGEGKTMTKSRDPRHAHSSLLIFLGSVRHNI